MESDIGILESTGPEVETKHRGSVDYQWLVGQHLNRILKIGAIVPMVTKEITITKESRDYAYVLNVKDLDAFLTPYQDRIYREEKQKLEKRREEFELRILEIQNSTINSISKDNQIEILRHNTSDKTDAITNFYREEFALLVVLLHRKALLLDEMKFEEIE